MMMVMTGIPMMMDIETVMMMTGLVGTSREHRDGISHLRL